jgi:Flp pilus assembly protein TadG
MSGDMPKDGMGMACRRLSPCEERGQSLIIVVVAMFVVLLIAAMSIDLATWYQKHHQQQVAADAAALAAAGCLADESATSTSPNTCTSPTDTSDASGVVTRIAVTNSASSANVSYSTTTSGTTTAISGVTVTTSAPNSTFFSGLLGLSSSANASAGASVTQNAADCSTSGAGCLMFYAAASNCSSPSITIQVGNSVNLNGGILSNGPIDDTKGNGGNFGGYISYGSGATCAGNTGFKSNASFAHNPTQQGVDYGSTTQPNWPINYATYFPACSGTGNAPTNCTSSAGTDGVTGTPNYCNVASTSDITTSTSNEVYCAVGSGTPSDPATWTGTITATSGTFTMLGGSVVVKGVTVNAYSHNLLAYAASASSTAFNASGGNTNWTGDVFAPSGSASVSGGNVTFAGMVEAQTISYAGGASTGDGPTYSGGNGRFPGLDALTS